MLFLKYQLSIWREPSILSPCGLTGHSAPQTFSVCFSKWGCLCTLQAILGGGWEKNLLESHLMHQEEERTNPQPLQASRVCFKPRGSLHPGQYMHICILQITLFANQVHIFACRMSRGMIRNVLEVHKLPSRLQGSLLKLVG